MSTDPLHMWLTREQIDHVLDNLTGQDILAGVQDDNPSGAITAGRAFDAAAKRLEVSNGTDAMLMVRPHDAVHVAQRLGELLNPDSPLAEKPEGGPPSVNTGESD